MKLIIQIPCLDEEETLPATLADLPRELPGFATVRRADGFHQVILLDDNAENRALALSIEPGDLVLAGSVTAFSVSATEPTPATTTKPV